MLIRNVTHEREIQRQLQQQDRLAAVGQMSAGIAHDFNNILAVILLYSEMALATPDIPPRLLERLRIIAQQSRRASELIEQILDFSRRSVLERRPMDLLPFVKEQTKLLRRTLPENIGIELVIAPDEYVVDADPTRMQQLMMNLAVNARDAMPRGGRLTIALAHRSGDRPVPCVACGSAYSSGWVALEVQDTGSGIDPAILPYIFEPFYTTKEPGKGTGLGLPQVFGIVKSHEGHISVDSQPGAGTVISIFLPAERQGKPHHADTDPTRLVRGQGQTILLVEDETVTRQALAEGLMLINYRVVPAANGKEALDYLRQRPQGIDLVLSDVVMPEMGGMALLRALRQDGLNLPVIFMTGHPAPPKDELEAGEDALIWLQKPPRLKQLSQIIAQALQ
jgi:nitrogen-specific signal transduction histidine kinase